MNLIDCDHDCSLIARCYLLCHVDISSFNLRMVFNHLFHFISMFLLNKDRNEKMIHIETMRNLVKRLKRALLFILLIFFRLILFIGTVSSSIFSLILFSQASHIASGGMLDQDQRKPFQVIFYAINGANLIISVIGIYGSFAQHSSPPQLVSVSVLD